MLSDAHKPIPIELLHQRLGHTRTNTLLYTSQHRCWADTIAMMSPEKFCDPCQIVTTRSNNRCKIPPSNPLEPGHTVYMDLLPPLSPTGLTPATTFKCYLWLVDRYSRYASIYGLSDYTADSVVTAINQFIAPSNHPVLIEPIDLHKIKADAGSQFTSKEFQEACADSRIAINLAAPKHQEQNSFAERTWQTVKIIADKLLVHSRLPPTFSHHALLYAVTIFNVIPVKKLVNKNGFPVTPYELFLGEKPRIGHLRVFGCPVVARKWIITNTEGKTLKNKTSQRSVKGVFIGLPSNQQGYLLYMPQSNRIAVSMDITFDEHFTSAILLSWTPFQDAMRLRPNESSNIDDYATLEHTGSAEDFPSMFEEGNKDTTKTSSSKDPPTINPGDLLLADLLAEDDEDKENLPIITQDSSDDDSSTGFK